MNIPLSRNRIKSVFSSEMSHSKKGNRQIEIDNDEMLKTKNESFSNFLVLEKSRKFE